MVAHTIVFVRCDQGRATFEARDSLLALGARDSLLFYCAMYCDNSFQL